MVTAPAVTSWITVRESWCADDGAQQSNSKCTPRRKTLSRQKALVTTRLHGVILQILAGALNLLSAQRKDGAVLYISQPDDETDD